MDDETLIEDGDDSDGDSQGEKDDKALIKESDDVDSDDCLIKHEEWICG